MTIAELERYMKSRARVKESQEKEKAAHNYILADLIGRSISRLYGSANKMPTLSEAYPSLFSKEEDEEKIQTKKDEVSALRFKLFAQSYNNKYKEVATKE